MTKQTVTKLQMSGEMLRTAVKCLIRNMTRNETDDWYFIRNN